jgi:chromosomal replication initiation ATPase DnaA
MRTLDEIMGTVERATGFSRADLLSRAKTKHVSIARNMFYFVAVAEGYTQQSVADFMSRKHAVVGRQARVFEGWIAVNDPCVRCLDEYYKYCKDSKRLKL